jgi:protease IV
MWNFIKNVLATIVGLFLFCVVSLILGVVVIAVMAGSGGDKVTVKDNSVLKLDLNKPIVENAVKDPFEDLGGAFSNSPSKIGLVQIKKAIEAAKNDPKIKGIYLQAEYPMTGWATTEEIRNALIAFKTSGKVIYSYSDAMTEKGYYIASVADHIYLNPRGEMEMNGLTAEYEFFKGTLDKLGIKPEIFKVGDYKSAVEVFTRDNMSEPSKEQTKVFLNNIVSHVYGNIAKTRKISVEQINRWADSLSIDKPADALKAKLITHVGYYDEFETDFKKTLKLADDKKINFIGLEKYLEASKDEDSDSKNKIAVIIGEGDIVTGKGDDGQIGSDDITAELKKAREDDDVKAVVLRINSGGGSALASDIMWREVQLTRKKKPVIASMADYAASGGYYMAMGCDSIVAQPTTITGSIGIFALLFNVEDMMKDKLGITFDRVTTHAHSDFPTVTHDMTAFEKNKLQRSIEDGYETFTSKAAAGRHIGIDKLKAVASGRVWSGQEAIKNGLIDRLGGIDDAVAVAARSAKLKPNDYQLKYLPKQKNFVESLFDKADEQANAQLLKAQFGEMGKYVKQVKQLTQLQGLQARMPYQLEVK